MVRQKLKGPSLALMATQLPTSRPPASKRTWTMTMTKRQRAKTRHLPRAPANLGQHVPSKRVSWPPASCLPACLLTIYLLKKKPPIACQGRASAAIFYFSAAILVRTLFYRRPHLQGRFSGRLATKEDEKRLSEECRLLAPLMGGTGKRGERSRLTLAKVRLLL
jgi:hypothetical protein